MSHTVILVVLIAAVLTNTAMSLLCNVKWLNGLIIGNSHLFISSFWHPSAFSAVRPAAGGGDGRAYAPAWPATDPKPAAGPGSYAAAAAAFPPGRPRPARLPSTFPATTPWPNIPNPANRWANSENTILISCPHIREHHWYQRCRPSFAACPDMNTITQYPPLHVMPLYLMEPLSKRKYRFRGDLTAAGFRVPAGRWGGSFFDFRDRAYRGTEEWARKYRPHR